MASETTDRVEVSMDFTALWALMCAELSGGQSFAAPES
jgi:hypothetical protein